MTRQTQDVSRLPKWAQIKIEALERDLASARALLSAGPEGSDTFADPHARAVRPLGTGTIIRFGGTGYDRTVDAHWSYGALTIQAHGGHADMVIKPMAANAFRIGWTSRR